MTVFILDDFEVVCTRIPMTVNQTVDISFFVGRRKQVLLFHEHYTLILQA